MRVPAVDGRQVSKHSSEPALLLQAHFVPYRASGNAAAVWHGDFFAGKGIGHVRIDTPSGLVVSHFRRSLQAGRASPMRPLCLTCPTNS